MATLIRPNQKPKAIHNLGWLLRNWQQVKSLGFNWRPDKKRMVDGVLVARIKDGGVYFCEYASLSVCWSWCDRPVFRGVEFQLRRIHDPLDAGRAFTIGDANWRAINKLDHARFTCFVLSDCVQLPGNDFYRQQTKTTPQ